MSLHSPICSFLILTGMGDADWSCLATVLLEACGSVRCWGWVRDLLGIGEPESRHVVWCASAACLRMFQQRFSGAEKRASALGGQDQRFLEGFLLELCGS